MKFFKGALLALTFILLLSAGFCNAKSIKVPKLYAFGFSASFNDTTVYFTEIQTMDSVWVSSKNKFLISRNNYSMQFKDYLESNLKAKDRTCVTVSSIDRKVIEKKYTKMKRKYIGGKGGYDVKFLTLSEFKFTPIDDSNENIEPEAKKLTKAEKKQLKEERKKKQKENKGKDFKRPEGAPQGGPGGMPGGGMPGGGMPGGGMPGGMGGQPQM